MKMTPAQMSTQAKGHKPDFGDSPVKRVLTNPSGDICDHCNKQCTETGEQGPLWCVGTCCV